MKSITEAELLEAIASAGAGPGPDEAKTAAELRAATGLSDDKLKEALKRLSVQGRLRVLRVKRPAIDGLMRPVPAYLVTPKRRA